jgi:hypothetical protein
MVEIFIELTFIIFRFADADASGKAKVLMTPQIFGVFGVTVRNPYG